MSLFNKLQTMADDHNARARRTEERQAAVPGHLRAIVAAAPDECVSEVVRVIRIHYAATLGTAHGVQRARSGDSR